jgi:NitT/TauT family transport system permease protein
MAMGWKRRSREVLIVDGDSNPDLQNLLEEAGLHPVHLQDFAAAREYLDAVVRHERPAPVAALVDIALAPGGSPSPDPPAGLRLMEEIKTLKLRPAIKVVPITGSGWGLDGSLGYEVLRRAGELGIVGWLTKPVSRERARRLARSLEPRRIASSLLQFNQSISSPARRFLGALAFVFPLVLWSALTYRGFVKPIFLPPPSQVIADLGQLLFHEGFSADIAASIYRVLVAFCLASALAAPLGILMGSFAPIEAFISPLCAFFRYIPASAFIPLIILWLGIDHAQKIAVIFMGVFFYLLVLIAATVANVPKEFIETAYTLGASRRQVLLRVVSPAALPGILENLRAMVGAAWTYLIVAELVAAQVGIGYRILKAERFLQTGQVVAGILVIGVIGILTDFGFRALIRLVSPWKE